MLHDEIENLLALLDRGDREVVREVDRGHAPPPHFDQDLVLSQGRPPERRELRLRGVGAYFYVGAARRGERWSGPGSLDGDAGTATRAERRPRAEARPAAQTGRRWIGSHSSRRRYSNTDPLCSKNEGFHPLQGNTRRARLLAAASSNPRMTSSDHSGVTASSAVPSMASRTFS